MGTKCVCEGQDCGLGGGQLRLVGLMDYGFEDATIPGDQTMGLGGLGCSAIPPPNSRSPPTFTTDTGSLHLNDSKDKKICNISTFRGVNDPGGQGGPCGSGVALDGTG